MLKLERMRDEKMMANTLAVIAAMQQSQEQQAAAFSDWFAALAVCERELGAVAIGELPRIRVDCPDGGHVVFSGYRNVSARVDQSVALALHRVDMRYADVLLNAGPARGIFAGVVSWFQQQRADSCVRALTRIADELVPGGQTITGADSMRERAVALRDALYYVLECPPPQGLCRHI